MGQAGVFEGLHGRLQQEPLLGVEALRLARRDAEEVRVELVHAVRETRRSRVTILPGASGSGS